jgi:hypothetical protein
LWDLFFPAPAAAFTPLDEEDFILQVHWVFTRIHSGASLAASSGGARGSSDYGATAVARVAGLLARSTPTAATVGNEKTLRVLASIYNLTGGAATAGWISISGWLSDGRLTLRLPVLNALHLGGSATTARLPGRRQDSRATLDTLYNQDDPSIREEVLDSRLRGSVPRVLRFFLRILRDNLARTSDWPSDWIYDST